MSIEVLQQGIPRGHSRATDADATVLARAHTALPFRVFETQHFVVTDRRVVVGAADPERRIVHETDGLPAAEAYARGVGSAPEQPDPVLGCDGIRRDLESAQRGVKGRVDEIFRGNNTVGFSTYGEPYHGVHVNQTLTGLAIGGAAGGAAAADG